MRSRHVGLYKSTEGQGMLGDMILRSGVSHTDERVIFEPLGWGLGMTYTSSGLICLDSERPEEHTFLHEWGHSALGIHGEEYECSGCNMAKFVPDRLNRKYCDSSNCTSGKECWDREILPRFAGWTHTGTDPGNPPACNITIEN
ncbi:MAG: hypothetical protein E3J72_17830 [Planctomycetota bacterium]|nr:MAG: hypothetical protein E3J72_17830 [Planctomycetota bacterium]